MAGISIAGETEMPVIFIVISPAVPAKRAGVKRERRMQSDFLRVSIRRRGLRLSS